MPHLGARGRTNQRALVRQAAKFTSPTSTPSSSLGGGRLFVFVRRDRFDYKEDSPTWNFFFDSSRDEPSVEIYGSTST
jgi:hypothetical protein